MYFRLDKMKKYIFITGISTGIGKNLALQLSKAGYHVLGTVRKHEDAEILRAESNGLITVLIADVTIGAEVESAIDQVNEIVAEDGLFALINNAGLAVPGPLELISEEDFRYQIEVNLFAVHKITNACLPLLKKYPQSYIINISSVSGIFNNPFMGAYCISKHALESMNEIYRRELRPFGIHVVSIKPGPLKTEIWRKNVGALDKYLESDYGTILSNADKIIQNTEKSALPVQKVSDLVLKILKDKKPKPGYIIHAKPLTMKILAYCIPAKIQDKLIFSALNKKDKMRPI